jgi:UDP-3-O-[3-hydroxymyristoyl] glucosamine N-acyltransferase
VPTGLSIVLTADPPRDAFYALLADAVRMARFERLPSRISPRANIARSATVEDNVVVEDGAWIGHGAVVLANTYVGRDVVIKPNATVGGDGFEIASPGGRRQIVPHAGGVWLAEGVEVGSSTCIDKGLFGDFTYLGPGTKLDNLIHFAHSAVAGPECSLVACCEVSGAVVLGRGVWVGPHAAINQSLRIGDNSYIGTGAIVTRHLPRHSLAYGSPAKVMAKVCSCRSKLNFVDDRADCGTCGKHYRLVDDEVVDA